MKASTLFSLQRPLQSPQAGVPGSSDGVQVSVFAVIIPDLLPGEGLLTGKGCEGHEGCSNYRRKLEVLKANISN